MEIDENIGSRKKYNLDKYNKTKKSETGNIHTIHTAMLLMANFRFYIKSYILIRKSNIHCNYHDTLYEV